MKYPFTPQLLDALPEELAELFRGLELKLLEEICSRLKIADQLNEVTVQDIRALRAHGLDLEDIKKTIADTTNIGMDKLGTLLDDVVERNQAYYTELIDLAQVTAPERLIDQEDVWTIYEQTKGAYRNITQSMGFLVREGRHNVALPPAKAYQWALDSAALQIQSGAISYNQAIASAVRQLADSGLCVAYDKNGKPLKNRVAYESGHIDHLDVAVRRGVMTGVNQLNQKYREQSMDYLETDLVETTAHLGARNIDGPNKWDNHEKWQGRWFRWKKYTMQYPNSSKGNYPDFDDSCGPDSVTGIGGANCRHSFYSVVEGVNEPTYSEADLDALKGKNHKFTFEGKEYDGYSATQMQRRVEAEIRKQKRRKATFEAAGLTEEATAAKNRLRALNEKYKAFSKAAGLPEQRERMKAYTPKTSLSSTAKSAIIRSSGRDAPSGVYTSIDRTWRIDSANSAEISEAIEGFASSFSNAGKEHSVIITKSGEAFSLTGTSAAVDPSVIGAEKLPGSVGVHNHPVPTGESRGDSFSRADLMFSARYGTGIEYLVSGSRRNAFEFLRQYTEEEIYYAWEDAFRVVRERALAGELIIDWEQEEILKVLAEKLEGFIFYENF